MFLDRVVSQVRLFKLFHRTLRHKLTDPQTVGDLAEERSAAHAERPFLYFEDRGLSYGEFNAAANRIAHWGRGCGLRAGDRVALLMENRPEFLCTWAGLAKLGVVVPLINPQLRGDSLRYVLGAADTFRAAAVEQLTVWAQRLGVEIIKSEQPGQGGDPAAVAHRAVDRALEIGARG